MNSLVYKSAMDKIAEYYSESFSSSKSNVNGKEDSRAVLSKKKNGKSVRVEALKLHGLPALVKVKRND